MMRETLFFLKNTAKFQHLNGWVSREVSTPRNGWELTQ